MNEKIMELLGQYSTSDSSLHPGIREEIRTVGATALPTLNIALFGLDGEAYVEVVKTLLAIAEDIFSEEGKSGLDPKTMKSIELIATKARQYAPEEVYKLSVDALTHWGYEVPPVFMQKVHTCHICNLKSTDLLVKICGLHFCDIPVCKNDAQVISTRFGQFDGSGGMWFCTPEHHQHANHNHIDWN